MYQTICLDCSSQRGVLSSVQFPLFLLPRPNNSKLLSLKIRWSTILNFKKIGRSSDWEALKLWNARSGYTHGNCADVPLPLRPDRPFHNLRASKSVDRQSLCISELRSSDFEAWKLWRGRSGICLRTLVVHMSVWKYLYLCHFDWERESKYKAANLTAM